MHAQCDNVVCASDSFWVGCRAKAAATEAEARVSQIEARDDEAVPAPTTRKSRAQARLAARRSELSVLKLQQAASAAAAQQLIESQAAAQEAVTEAPSVDAAAQQQLFSSSSSADAAAAATQEGADKAQQELAADVAAQAMVKAAEVVKAAQQQLEAASGKEHAQIAESSLRQMKEDAAAAAQKEAAVTVEAARRQMAADASAAAAKKAAVTAEAAQQQMAADASAAAAKEAVLIAQVAQQQIEADPAAAAKEAAVSAEPAQQQMAAHAAAAAAANQEAALIVTAAQKELQAHAVAAADMQTAEAAAAVQQKLRAEAEAAACTERQPFDMAAEHEAAERGAALEQAGAIDGLQIQLEAVAAARTWEFEQSHTTELLSASEQPGSQIEQVHAGLFEQEVKEATVIADPPRCRKEPDLIASQLGTVAQEAVVSVVRNGCGPVRSQTHSSDSSSQLHPKKGNGASSCPAHTDLVESHSTADGHTYAPVSAKSGAEKQVMVSPAAPHAPKAAASITPATTASSQVTNLP